MHRSRIVVLVLAFILFGVYSLTAPQNHSEAEDAYDYALKVEQGGFAQQAGVNRVLALPVFGVAYRTAKMLGYSGRAFPFMVFINRLLAVAGVLLFWKLLELSSNSHRANGDHGERLKPDARHLSIIHFPLPTAFLLAFSYGFWRYANEAETYILASVFVLGAWCLAVKGHWKWCLGISAVGVLVHLLNLIPLLVVIPIYYLLLRQWKKAVVHGAVAGSAVGLVYVLSFHMLDWSQLGAHHHMLESGFGLSNLMRGFAAFGQAIVSGNFIFGFEPARQQLENAFPSRMLSEEFFMAEHMPGWIPWSGCLTLVSVGIAGLGVLFYRQAARDRGASPLMISWVFWLLLYAGSVILTEAGSPELWILGLIPFWLLFHLFAYGGREKAGRAGSGFAWALVGLLFTHNLTAGLLPVMSSDGDYHAAKGAWLVDHAQEQDVILIDYEPIMIFYLNYYARAPVINSGAMNISRLQHILGTTRGKGYAFGSFFQPMESMRVRNPDRYGLMLQNGAALQPGFVRIVDDEFGGVWVWENSTPIDAEPPGADGD